MSTNKAVKIHVQSRSKGGEAICWLPRPWQGAQKRRGISQIRGSPWGGRDLSDILGIPVLGSTSGRWILLEGWKTCGLTEGLQVTETRLLKRMHTHLLPPSNTLACVLGPPPCTPQATLSYCSRPCALMLFSTKGETNIAHKSAHMRRKQSQLGPWPCFWLEWRLPFPAFTPCTHSKGQRPPSQEHACLYTLGSRQGQDCGIAPTPPAPSPPLSKAHTLGGSETSAEV